MFNELNSLVMENYDDGEEILKYFPKVNIDYNNIKCVMINEVVADSPEDDFYGEDSSNYMETTKLLFSKAGLDINNIEQLNDMGIYITNAIKVPKGDREIDSEQIKVFLPILEKELSCFPNLQVIMLMGDVAKKSLNMLVKRKSGKNLIPSISTYKLLDEEFYYGEVRVLLAYIMTGKNILIEKSKQNMNGKQILKMLNIIKTTV